MATAVAVVAVALVAQAGAAGPTTVSSTYTVSSDGVPGASTGLVLTAGMSVTVAASGTVCPFGGGLCPGPDGYAPWDTTTSLYGGFVLPGAPAWGLVGKVGSGPWAQVGSGPTTLQGTGELVLAVNDDLFSDNTGSFTVTVSYSCWPGWGWGDENHTHCGPPGLEGKDVPGAGTPSNGNAYGHDDGDPPAQPGANANGKAKGHTK
ncbi:MAG: hypothetical protein M5U27_13205 [Gaiella sp.]|nr:hypothetical protein [Gaiella sp.]